MFLQSVRRLRFPMRTHFPIANTVRRRGVSVIMGALILLLIVVSMAGLIFAYASNSSGVIGGNLSNLLGSSSNKLDEQLEVEQSYFNYTSTGQATSYVPVTVTNSQTSATSAPFQQMVTVDPASYTSYEATDLGNIRFFSSLSGSTFSGALDSWLEYVSSTPANQASSATFWLNLPTGIGASSSVTIYMVFESTSIEFDGVIAGEAPQLSASFGQYDNGANVFLYYNNGGSTSNLNVVNGGSVTVTTQTNPYGGSTSVLTLTGSGSTTTSSETVAWYTSSLVGDNFIAEGWINIGTNLNGLFAIRGASSSTNTNYLLGDGWTGDEASVVYESGTTNTLLSGSGARSAAWMWDMATISGSSLSTTVYSGGPPYLGGTVSSTTTVTDTTLGASNQYVGIGTWSGGATAAYFFGVRIRSDPPGGVMPSTLAGSISQNVPTQAGAVLYIANVGGASVNVAAIYVQNALTSQLVTTLTFSTPIAIQSGAIQAITVDFTPSTQIPYEFTIATQSGNAFTYTVVS